MPPVKKPWPRTLEEFVALEELCVSLLTGRDVPQTALTSEKARPRSGVQLLNSTREEWASCSPTVPTRKLSKADIHPYFHTLLEKAVKLLDGDNARKQNVVDLREDCLSSLELSEADVRLSTKGQGDITARVRAQVPAPRVRLSTGERVPIEAQEMGWNRAASRRISPPRPPIPKSAGASSKSFKRKFEELQDDDRADKRSKLTGTIPAIPCESIQGTAETDPEDLQDISHMLDILASNPEFRFPVQDPPASSISSPKRQVKSISAHAQPPKTMRGRIGTGQATTSATEFLMPEPSVSRYNPDLMCPTPSRPAVALLGPQSHPAGTPEYFIPRISMSGHPRNDGSWTKPNEYLVRHPAEASHVSDEHQAGVAEGVDPVGLDDVYSTEPETLCPGSLSELLMQFGPPPPTVATSDDIFAPLLGDDPETGPQSTVLQSQALFDLESYFTETFDLAGITASEQFNSLMEDPAQYESNTGDTSRW